MSKQRTRLQAEDLSNGVLVVGPSGRVYQLGPPKKINVNLNVVNHCQLYTQKGELAITPWQNLTNLRDNGFKLYTTPGQLPLRVVRQSADG